MEVRILVVRKCHLCVKVFYICASVLTGTCCSMPFRCPAPRNASNQLTDVVSFYYRVFSLFAHLEHWRSLFSPSLDNRST